jgi:hypothetical protein
VDDELRCTLAAVGATVTAARMYGATIRQVLERAVTAAVAPGSTYPAGAGAAIADEVCGKLNAALLGQMVSADAVALLDDDLGESSPAAAHHGSSSS